MAYRAKGIPKRLVSNSAYEDFYNLKLNNFHRLDSLQGVGVAPEGVQSYAPTTNPYFIQS